MRHERVVLMAFGSPLEKTATKERHDESAKLTDETRGSSSDRVARIERPESGRMRDVGEVRGRESAQPELPAAPGAGRKAKRRIGQRSQTEQTRTE
ncbi:hypothetical protein NSND_50199 [Nitrospira sp. ND1]|nr:hypothetical protein NSND_50199 [Nitrospira sp. ND1]